MWLVYTIFNMDPQFMPLLAKHKDSYEYDSDDSDDSDVEYDCNFCDKSYLSKSSLNRHIKNIHTRYFCNAIVFSYF